MTKKEKTAQERYEFVASQHGGFWRHDFIDHNYLYNLYFPPEEFFSHLRDNIKQLVLNYPIGQKDLAALVGELIEQPPERIVVGNGAAEPDQDYRRHGSEIDCAGAIVQRIRQCRAGGQGR